MKQWYVVHTKPRQESIAIENLLRQGYIVYCPKIVQPRYRRQRWQKVVEPLFPRYLFMQLASGLDDFAPIRSTHGVDGFVRFGRQPAVMPQDAINAIQQQEYQYSSQNAGLPAWKPGDRIEIIDGAFAGLKAIFESAHGVERAILLLDMLGKSNRISVDINSLMTAR